MKPFALALALAALPALSGCLIIDADDGQDDFSVAIDSGPAGTVYGASVLEERIDFLVTSNGCTDKSYFELDIEPAGSSRVSLELERIRTDTCEAWRPGGETVSWTFSELGIAPGTGIIIVNPVQRR